MAAPRATTSATAESPTRPARGELDAYAVCDSKIPADLVRSKTKSVSRCPPEVMRSDPQGRRHRGRQVPEGKRGRVSGGFASPGNRSRGRARPIRSPRSGSASGSGRSRRSTTTSSQRRKLKAFAYCDKSEPGLDVKSDRIRPCTSGDKTTLDLELPRRRNAGLRWICEHLRQAEHPAGCAFTFTSRPISGDRWRVSAFGSGGAARRWGAERCTKSRRAASSCPSTSPELHGATPTASSRRTFGLGAPMPSAADGRRPWISFGLWTRSGPRRRE